MPRKPKDITGQLFTRLTVSKDTLTRGNAGQVIWECVCLCGNVVTAATSDLRSGNKKSCGCLGKERKQAMAQLLAPFRQKAADARRKNHIGDVVEWLTVEAWDSDARKWKLRCKCGNTRLYKTLPKDVKSCGCWRFTRDYREACQKSALKHGQYRTKAYKNSKGARRRSAIFQATPAWADQIATKAFYQLKPRGHVVDHDIPLNPRNKKVCGLHVINNFKYLTPEENTRKADNFRPYTEIKATGERIYL